MAIILVDNQNLLFERLHRAQETILRSKRLDGLKGKATVIEIQRQMGQLQANYYHLREKLIQYAQQRNVHPERLPGDFVHFDQIIKLFGQLSSDTGEVDGMILSSISDYSRFLTSELLLNITHRWLGANGITFANKAIFCFNDTFIWNILNYQQDVIRHGDLETINFLLTAQDRPFIYVYYPEQEIDEVEEINQQLNDWDLFEQEYIEQIRVLGEQEVRSSRGDFWVNDYGKQYTEHNQLIYQTESKFFWDYVECLYVLSDEHPEYFQKGATSILDGLHKHFSELLFGNAREVGRDQFEAKAIQQFLYFSNGHREIRIDLFRNIDATKQGLGDVFTGGLFHVFDHFNGLQASADKGAVDLHENFLLSIIRDLFFNHLVFEKKLGKTGEQFTSRHLYNTPIQFNNGSWLYKQKFWNGVFYYDPAKNCFSLTTLHLD